MSNEERAQTFNIEDAMSQSEANADEGGEYTRKEMFKEQRRILNEMNEKHAVMLQEGGKTRVMSWDESGNRPFPVLQSFDDFKNRYCNETVPVIKKDGRKRGGEQEEIVHTALGHWWLCNHNRRQYLQMVFKPGDDRREIKKSGDDGYMNLWRGFGVTPKKGGWEKIDAHIKNILANESENAHEYIVKWTAWSLQNPAEPPEVAVVFRGGLGVGKGIYARALCKMFGRHSMHITTASHITGNFNSHLRDCCFLFADEAMAPGNKHAESVMKGLITEPVIAIEGKGRDVVQAQNHLHIMMASNEDWVVPAGHAERRFAVFNVSDAKQKNEEYFDALDKQIENGGLAAMMYDLVNMDLGGWHPRAVPQTIGLNEQKAQSLPAHKKALLDILRTGSPIQGSSMNGGQMVLPTRALASFARRYKRNNEQIATDTAIGLMLRRDLKFDNVKNPVRGADLGRLDDARHRWDEAFFKIEWDDSEEWDASAEGDSGF